MAARNPKWLLVTLAVIVLGLQLVPVDRSNPPVDPTRTLQANAQVPGEVESILKRACFDCHSQETRWPWYAYVAPFSWVVADDVHHAQSHINFSQWAQYDRKEADDRLEEMCEEVESGGMPLTSYRWMHSEARLSAEEVETLCNWTQQERGRLQSSAPEEAPATD